MKNSIIKLMLIMILLLLSTEIALRLTGKLYLDKLYGSSSHKNAKTINTSTNILCLGESTTMGLWVNFNDSYPKQLEKLLRQHYNTNSIISIVPPHVGQNTSQVKNRIKNYISLFNPKLIILMMGANNEWALAESSITCFLKYDGLVSLKIKLWVFFNKLRTFKFVRFWLIKFFNRTTKEVQFQNRFLIYGHPEIEPFPPQKWKCDFAVTHRELFLEGWRYDIRKIIEVAKMNNIKVILMTYPLNPTYLNSSEFIELSTAENIPLLRNDVLFDDLNASLTDYLCHDKWHPNEKGYQLIAKNIYTFLISDTNFAEIFAQSKFQ